MTIAYIKRIDLSKQFTVEVKQKRSTRSLPQNRLMWLWLTCLEVETGNDRNDLHEYFKERFLPAEERKVFDSVILTRSTSGLNTAQMKDYLDKIQIFASTELGISLPDPESQRWEEFYSFYSDRYETNKT
jgi:hypothetical protein